MDVTDILFTRHAAASFLDLKPSGLRMAIRRGTLREESQGLIPLDELEKYLLKYRRKKPQRFTPLPEGYCTRCGILDNMSMCELCRKEEKTGHYTWYANLDTGSDVEFT